LDVESANNAEALMGFVTKTLKGMHRTPRARAKAAASRPSKKLAKIMETTQTPEVESDEEDWIFDCLCGLRGKIDDGEHSIGCGKCNRWLHSRCVGLLPEEAEKDDFHFVCNHCHVRKSF